MLNKAMVTAALEAREMKSQSAKDSSLSLLPVGKVAKTTSLSSSAEPRNFSLSLTEKERAAVRASTRTANPDDEEDSGTDSDSSEDGIKAIRDDLARQKQVQPPSSPKENRFLAGFMKPTQEQQQKVEAKRALDKDPISLIPPFVQAANEPSLEELGQTTGDVPGHGSSMAVQHGSLSLDLSDDAHDKDLRLATEVIRNGTSLLSSQTPSAERNNLVVPSQVDNASGSRSTEEEFEKLLVMDTLIATWRHDHPGAPLPRSYQKHVDKSDMTEKLAKHSKEQVALTVPANSHLSGQPVLGMSFFVNKRKEIARLAGNSVLRDKYDL